MKQTPLKIKKGWSVNKSRLQKKKSSFKRISKRREDVDYIKADSFFSKNIIERDKKCLRCGRTVYLSCAHFKKREMYAVRYDEDNCITLCTIECHPLWEGDPKGEFQQFMLVRLGSERFFALEEKSIQRISLPVAAKEFLDSGNIINQDIQY